MDVAFEVTPTRFWRVTFSARGQTVPPYAVVLPDGRPVEPTVDPSPFCRAAGVTVEAVAW